MSFLDRQRPLAEFSGRELRAIIDSFAQPLGQHLHDEIDTLLALAKYGDGLDLAGIMAHEGKTVMAQLSKTAVLPAFLLNHDVTYEGGLHKSFPPVPKPVRWVLIHICTLWRRAWWKYASCDTNGMPKLLQGAESDGFGPLCLCLGWHGGWITVITAVLLPLFGLGYRACYL